MYVQPAVAGELVFVGSCSGVYYAFERDTGEVRWSYDTNADARQTTFHTNPVVTEELVVTGTDGGSPGTVYAFERETGKVRWKKLLEQGQVSADLALVGDSILALAANGDLVALDAASGEERWVFAPPNEADHRRGSLATNGKVVFTAGMDEAIHAIDATDGREIWKRTLGSRVTTSILLDGTDLYVGTADGYLWRLDARSGTTLASLDAGEAPGGTLVLLDNSTVAFLRREPSRELTVVDTELRKVGWAKEPEKGSWSTDRPILWQGLLLAGDSHGNLLALDPKDGSTRWSAKLEGQIRGIGYEGETLFVGTIGGILYAVATEPAGKNSNPEGNAASRPPDGL